MGRRGCPFKEETLGWEDGIRGSSPRLGASCWVWGRQLTLQTSVSWLREMNLMINLINFWIGYMKLYYLHFHLCSHSRSQMYCSGPAWSPENSCYPLLLLQSRCSRKTETRAFFCTAQATWTGFTPDYSRWSPVSQGQRRYSSHEPLYPENLAWAAPCLVGGVGR